MPSTYVHLSGKETEQTLLQLHGVQSEEAQQKPLFTPITCPRCDTRNPHDTKFCGKCGVILDMREAVELEAKQHEQKITRDKTDLIMNMLMKDPEVVAVIKQKLENMQMNV